MTTLISLVGNIAHALLPYLPAIVIQIGAAAVPPGAAIAAATDPILAGPGAVLLGRGCAVLHARRGPLLMVVQVPPVGAPCSFRTWRQW